MRRARPVLGLTALAGSVAASAWLAIGAAGTSRWSELPTPSYPSWAAGPLHGLRGLVGTLSEGGLGAGLIVLLVAYAVALACAEAIPLRWALAAIGLANLAFTLGPSILSTDVFGYIAYGREVALHGLNPYVSAPAAIGRDQVMQFIYWKGEPSPYGPLFTLLSVPLGLVSVTVALWTFKALTGIAAVALAVLTARVACARGVSPVRAAIFVGLNPVLLFYAVSGAHNDLFGALLVLGALALAERDRDRWAGIAAVLASGIKVTFGLALAFVVGRGRRRGRAAAGAGVGVLVLSVMTVAVFGTHVFDQLHRITEQARFDTRFSGPDRLAVALGTHITTGLRTACLGLAAALAVWAAVRVWRGGDPLAAAGWAFAGLAAAIASLAPWYLVWVLPLAALGRSRTLWATAVLATLYLVGVHLPALGGHPWIAGPG